MGSFKDVFISYGRAESKAFATKLHDRLEGEGLDVWFDQNDIPLGVDFQNQIDEGIEEAHNFIFIIAPHAIKSEYCLREVVLAVKRRKRIIPILHIEPTEQVVWDKLHPTISKLNWIYMREQEDKALPLSDWKSIDDFDAGFEGVMTLINSHQEYVTMHTNLLEKALLWQNNQKASAYLLEGKQRLDGQKWLEYKFRNEQPPCSPSELHSEFITESKKYANGMGTDIFISYDQYHRDEMLHIRQVLTEHDFTTWIDYVGIKMGRNFEDAINEGIEKANNFLFLITPQSVVSEYCLKELEYALSLNKRIFTLLIKTVDDKEIPAEIQHIQYVDFTDNIEVEGHLSKNEKTDFEKDIDELVNNLNQEKEYYHQHKELLVDALIWQRQKENPAILWDGYKLEEGLNWFNLGEKRKEHQPIDLQKTFLEASQVHSSSFHPELYLAFSQEDGDFVRRLNIALEEYGKVTYVDDRDITEEEGLKEELFGWIEEADNFLFILSVHSMENAVEYLEYAEQLGKRVVLAVYEDIPQDYKHHLKEHHIQVDFRRRHNDFNDAFRELIRVLDVDRGYIKNLNKWSQKTLEWDKKDRDKDQLLRGSEFLLAQAWLADVLEADKKPAPNALLIAYVEESRKRIEAEERAERKRLFFLKVLLGVMAGLFVMAVGLGWMAKEAETKAEANAEQAKREKNKAEKEKSKAEAAEKESEFEKEKALCAKDEAEQAKVLAEEAERLAKIEKQRADIERQKAVENAKLAEIERQKASVARDSAFLAQKRAEDAKDEAEKQKSKAERLYLLSEARELANKAIKLNNNNQNSISQLLALHAFYLHKENGGGQQNHIIYQSLSQVIGQDIIKAGEQHERGVKSVQYNESKQMYASAGPDGVFFWRKSQRKTPLKVAEKIKLNRIRFSKDGQTLFGGTVDGEVLLWDLTDFSSQGQLNVDGVSGMVQVGKLQGEVLSISVAHNPADGKDYIVAVTEQEAKVFYRESAQQVREVAYIQEQGLLTSAISFGKEGGCIVAGGEGETPLYIYDLNMAYGEDPQLLKPVKQLPFESYKVTALSFDHDGEFLAIGASNGVIQVGKLEEQSFKSYRTLLGHRSFVTGLAFDKNNRQLASCALDNTTRLWLFKELEEEAIILKNDSKWVWDVAFDNKHTVMSSGEAGVLHFWATDPEKLAEKVCDIVDGRKLTKKELSEHTKANINYEKPNCVSW